MWSVPRDRSEAGLGPGVWGPRPRTAVRLTPRAQVLLHRAAESLLLPAHGALDPSRGALGGRQEAAPGASALCARLPVLVLRCHELPGGWSLL